MNTQYYVNMKKSMLSVLSWHSERSLNTFQPLKIEEGGSGEPFSQNGYIGSLAENDTYSCNLSLMSLKLLSLCMPKMYVSLSGVADIKKSYYQCGKAAAFVGEIHLLAMSDTEAGSVILGLSGCVGNIQRMVKQRMLSLSLSLSHSLLSLSRA